jgi:hypothetical protein
MATSPNAGLLERFVWQKKRLDLEKKMGLLTEMEYQMQAVAHDCGGRSHRRTAHPQYRCD